MLQAPFPWFGGKRRVAPIVWRRFGTVRNYVEPFFGSGAVLLGRPQPDGSETVNDKDAYVCNFWRAIQADPDGVADRADWPSNENDLHARHVWLRERGDELKGRLEADPDYHDAKVAGWWVWGMAQWIGSGFCGESGAGPWSVVDGKLVRSEERGVTRRRVHLGDGRGVVRQKIHLGDDGRGVGRQKIHLGDEGQGVARNVELVSWMRSLADRLRRVRVCSGDWTRVLGPSVTTKHGMTAVFLDPPYSTDERDTRLYATDAPGIARDVLAWCRENGENPLLRIALCGYDTEHAQLEAAGWDEFVWKAHGGYSNLGQNRGRENAHRERIWFSPACCGQLKQSSLFS